MGKTGQDEFSHEPSMTMNRMYEFERIIRAYHEARQGMVCALTAWTGWPLRCIRVGEASHPGPAPEDTAERLECPGCSNPMQYRRAGANATCSMCAGSLDGRLRAYACEPCAGVICTGCAEGLSSEDHANGEDQQNEDSAEQRGRQHGDSEALAPVQNGEEASEAQRLLSALRSLPEAFPTQPVQWIPRRCKEAAADVMRTLLLSAAERATDPQGVLAAETAHLLLRASPQILFRPVWKDVSLSGSEAEDAQPTTALAIRDRLHRAAQGQWLELTRECLADIATIRDMASMRTPRSGTTHPSGITDAMLQAAALKSRNGSDRGACQILTGGPPVPPGAETDAKVHALFRTQELSEQEAYELHSALSNASRGTRRMHIGPWHASRSVARLRLVAGPGPSGFRNSYIAVIHSHPDGAKALAAWAAIWAQATTQPWLADIWTAALVRPFFKANGVDIRPILCAEALLKFAVGTAIRRADRQLAAAMGERQFGAGRPGGAAMEIGEIRAAAKLKPNDALVSLDIKNAFGSVQWKDALQAVTRAIPKLAPILAVQWAACRLRLWLQDATGAGWHVMVIYGSLLQGGLDGHPVFCLVIGVVAAKIGSNVGLAHFWKRVTYWMYVDDMLFQCPIEHVAQMMGVVRCVLEDFALVLQTTKCQLHIPALAAVPEEAWPEAARALAEVLPIAHVGLTVLGTEAAGNHALPLGPRADAATETRKRAAGACTLAEAAMQLVARPPPAGGKQVAFRIIRNIVAHSLDYDARVLPSSLVLPHARQVEEKCWEVLEAVIGRSLTDAQREQVEIPTCMGGLQTPMPTQTLGLARAANLIEVGPAVRAAVAAWGYTVQEAMAMDGVDEAVAEGLLEDALIRGISFGPCGAPLAEPLTQVQDAYVLRPPVPQRHLLGTFLQVVAQRRYNALFQDMDARGRTRLLSASGPTAGKALIAPAGLRQTHFGDVVFTQILHWRLGVPSGIPVQRCCNMKANGDPCEDILDLHADHALICPCGPLRILRHNTYADELAGCIAETGAHVRREAWIGELANEHSDAVLDIWAFGTLDVSDLLIDVTLRHPMAATYQPVASRSVGHAASAGVQQKMQRYPAAGGRTVTPFAIETWGRLDAGAEVLLETWAAAATRREALRGRASPPGGCLKRWRAALDAVVQRGVALALLAARAGLAGRPHRAPAPTAL